MMSLIFRLSNPKFGKQLAQLYNRQCVISQVRCVQLKASQYQPPLEETHDERNARLGRPQSPHLSIYSIQLTTLLSITHRFTGCALAGYAVCFACVPLLPHDISYYIETLEALKIGAPILFASKLVIAYPLSFHFFSGIRHIFWDFGKFLTIKEVYTTGYIMAALSVAGSIAAASL